MMRYFLDDEQATLDLGAQLAHACPSQQCIIYLSGELGVGKTTLVRGFLRALGYQGAVKSPTYTLVEPYQLDHRQLFHFDLYRIHDPEELMYLGLEEYFNGTALCLIEWPSQAAGLLPKADIDIELHHHQQSRQVKLTAYSPQGEMLCRCYQP